MRRRVLKSLVKAGVVLICVSGYFYQTLEFLLLYLTYPTVVDIQVSIPSEIEMPAISICSTNGVNPAKLCELGDYCLTGDSLDPSAVCEGFPAICVAENALSHFTAVNYDKFFRENNIKNGTSEFLKMPLKDYLECKIISGVSERPCDLDNVLLGSYYGTDQTPNFCYTLFSHWKNPKAEVQKVKKSETINLRAQFDCTFKIETVSEPPVPPLHQFNCMSFPAVQLSLHSRHRVDSPFVKGVNLEAGRKYRVTIKQDEKHLLPPPYQTNCTEYMPDWVARGGVGPLSQVMVVEECKLNASLQKLGCVPFSVNYPHNETICKYCQDCPEAKLIEQECAQLLSYYNQPCDSIDYIMNAEEVVINIEKIFSSVFTKFDEVVIVKTMGYDCSDNKRYNRECQSVEIDIDFDEFEITNISYIPKFETLEMFSVIGGYTGMYLGISIVAIYDFAESLMTFLVSYVRKSRRRRNKQRANRSAKDVWRQQGWDGYQYPSAGVRKRSMQYQPRDIY
ncbi:hypothetical protein JTE90_015285 [Oedothorax gibbosus]|uniref:Uncharacterized protein n=1 Tax=Oedothorax gibbosus TaxID=931172 RepID=A0AAV6UCR7_9ARAC|nr:hypothetical protein JTE90_015285 [Oedothorax gibbosus]